MIPVIISTPERSREREMQMDKERGRHGGGGRPKESSQRRCSSHHREGGEGGAGEEGGGGGRGEGMPSSHTQNRSPPNPNLHPQGKVSSRPVSRGNAQRDIMQLNSYVQHDSVLMARDKKTREMMRDMEIDRERIDMEREREQIDRDVERERNRETEQMMRERERGRDREREQDLILREREGRIEDRLRARDWEGEHVRRGVGGREGERTRGEREEEKESESMRVQGRKRESEKERARVGTRIVESRRDFERFMAQAERDEDRRFCWESLQQAWGGGTSPRDDVSFEEDAIVFSELDLLEVSPSFSLVLLLSVYPLISPSSRLVPIFLGTLSQFLASLSLYVSLSVSPFISFCLSFSLSLSLFLSACTRSHFFSIILRL